LFNFLGSNFFIPLYMWFFSCYEALSVCMYAKGFSHPVESLSFCFVRIFVRNRWYIIFSSISGEQMCSAEYDQ
jgi:hypothetical protein